MATKLIRKQQMLKKDNRNKAHAKKENGVVSLRGGAIPCKIEKKATLIGMKCVHIHRLSQRLVKVNPEASRMPLECLKPPKTI